MTVRTAAKTAAMVFLNGLLGAAVGVMLGVVVVYVAPMHFLRNDPHRWYMLVLLILVCSASGVMYTFRESSWRRSAADSDDSADQDGCATR